MEEINTWLEAVDKKLYPVSELIASGKEIEKKIGRNVVNIKDAINIMALTDQLDHLQKISLSEKNQLAVNQLINALDNLDISDYIRLPYKSKRKISVEIDQQHITIKLNNNV